MSIFSKKNYSNCTDKQLEAKFNTSKKVLLDSQHEDIDRNYLVGHYKRYKGIEKEFGNR